MRMRAVMRANLFFLQPKGCFNKNGHVGPPRLRSGVQVESKKLH
jgi:hypothetical protein